MHYVLEALVVICFDIILPTSDNSSDLFFVYYLIHNGDGNSGAGSWAFVLTLPVIINIIITL
jgi:hypothetical protein